MDIVPDLKSVTNIYTKMGYKGSQEHHGSNH